MPAPTSAHEAAEIQYRRERAFAQHAAVVAQGRPNYVVEP